MLFGVKGVGSGVAALGLVLATVAFAESTKVDEVAALRLVPFPKKIVLVGSRAAFSGKWVLELPPDTAFLAQMIIEEFGRAGLPAPELSEVSGNNWRFGLRRADGPLCDYSRLPKFRPEATPADYVLGVFADQIVAVAPDRAGLFHAVMTLCQLIRANRAADGTLPCVVIEDWPLLRWRCFQDDLTRGPSTKLDSLQHGVWPWGYTLNTIFGPTTWNINLPFGSIRRLDRRIGSLTAEELRSLVSFGKHCGIEILGNQQSVGHFQWILRHENLPICGKGQIC